MRRSISARKALKYSIAISSLSNYYPFNFPLDTLGGYIKLSILVSQHVFVWLRSLLSLWVLGSFVSSSLIGGIMRD